MSSTYTIQVHAANGDYRVVCGRRLLRKAGREIARLGRFSSVHILSSRRVWRAVGERVREGIPSGPMRNVHLFDDAETAKNLKSVEGLARRLVQAGADRHSLLVAIGGGVVGDVGGFVAASYLRGIPLVQVPTTVVAQVDSAVGGKTGVNLPEGKNLVGAFYSPKLVLVDPDVLASLPEREFRGGLAEVIKYGVIADRRLFRYLELNLDRILKHEAKPLDKVIQWSISIKARVVSKDEREAGLREILNFGHTFGHALESVTRYRKYQHGEAVAWGMMCAALLGYEVAKTPANDVARLISLVRRIGPLPAWPDAPARTLFRAMGADKKARFGTVRLVLAPRLGQARSYDGVAEKLVRCVLHYGPGLVSNSTIGLENCHG